MNKLLLTIFLLVLNGITWAETAIRLHPMEGDEALDIVETRNYTGSCGESIVRVLGVKSVYEDFYTVDLDAAKIIVRSGPNNELILRPEGTRSNNKGDILLEHNGVACVSIKYGNRLLVWSGCSGSACGDR